MANTPLRADSVRANPIARRDILAGVMLASVVSVAAPIAFAAPEVTLWQKAVAEYRDIAAFWDAFLATAYNPAVDELNRRAPMPPSFFTITAKSGATQNYHHDRADPWGWASHPIPAIAEPGRKQAELWERWEKEYANAKAAVNMDALDKQDDWHARESGQARDRLISTPVRDAAELLEKMEVLWTDGFDADLFRDELLRDVRAVTNAQAH
ncbi:MAG: hypothetical protein KJ585_03940 [Alphaproteobacteria bacterium]|nr:hypothetical protein [Alphaproteobacteria bacterium]